MAMMATSVFTFTSCDAKKPEGTFYIGYPTSGKMVLPGPDGWHAEGKVWLGNQGARQARINAYNVEETSGSWAYEAQLDVISYSEVYEDWCIDWYYGDGTPYEGASKKNGKKIRVCGFTYSK